MNDAKHSPLPWTIKECASAQGKSAYLDIGPERMGEGEAPACRTARRIGKGGGQYSHELEPGTVTERDRANAALIIEAVNSRARLLAERDEAVAALRGLRTTLAARAGSPLPAAIRDEELRDLDALLSRLEDRK